MVSAHYQFEPLAAADLPMIERWLAMPHVAQWWDDDQEIHHIRAHLDNAAIDVFLVRADGRPLGYLQCYDPRAEDDHPFRDQPEGTRGIDCFIGEPDMIGHGHGTAMIEAFVDRLLASGAPRVVTDPDPDNRRAIRVYEKVGFAADRIVDTAWGRTLLMTRNP